MSLMRFQIDGFQQWQDQQNLSTCYYYHFWLSSHKSQAFIDRYLVQDPDNRCNLRSFGHDIQEHFVVGIYDRSYASRGRIGCNSAGKGKNISCGSDSLECDCIGTKVKAGHLFIQTGEVRLLRTPW